MAYKAKTKRAAVLVVLSAMLSVLFTSCLEGYEYKPTSFGYFTVKEAVYSPSGLVLIQDITGYKYYPSKESVANLGGLKGVERAFLEFSFQEGEEYVDGKTEYHVDLLNTGYSFGILTKGLSSRPDTLRNDSLLKYSAMWAYGGYITTETQVFVSDRVFMDMTQERVSNDTLYLHLNQNLSPKKPYARIPVYNSFRMPSATELQHEGILAKEDSIVVAVSANVAQMNGSKTEYIYWKCKLE